MTPLPQGENAVVCGAGGAIGGAGLLAGRTVAGPEEMVGEIPAARGLAGVVRAGGFDGRRGEENTGA